MVALRSRDSAASAGFGDAATSAASSGSSASSTGRTASGASDAAKAFARAKASVDAIPAGHAPGQFADPALLRAIEECLSALADARRAIDRELVDGGLAGQPPDQRQQWRLAEIGLEEYAFVLLSRGINALGAEDDPPRNEMSGEESRAALRMLAAASGATDRGAAS